MTNDFFDFEDGSGSLAPEDVGIERLSLVSRMLVVLRDISSARAIKEKFINDWVVKISARSVEDEVMVDDLLEKRGVARERKKRWESLEALTLTELERQEEMVAKITADLNGLEDKLKLMRGDYCPEVSSGNGEMQSELPDPQRRLQALRALKGEVRCLRGAWRITGIAELVRQEKAKKRPRSDPKTIRADLQEAAAAEREAKREGAAGASWHPG